MEVVVVVEVVVRAATEVGIPTIFKIGVKMPQFGSKEVKKKNGKFCTKLRKI